MKKIVQWFYVLKSVSDLIDHNNALCDRCQEMEFRLMMLEQSNGELQKALDFITEQHFPKF